MAIITTHHGYKRPPRKRAKAAASEGPAIVRAKKPGRKSAADQRQKLQPVDAAVNSPANDDRKSVIVTARRPGKRYVDVTEEEHRRVGDLADAMFQEMKRRIAEKTKEREP